MSASEPLSLPPRQSIFPTAHVSVAAPDAPATAAPVSPRASRFALARALAGAIFSGWYGELLFVAACAIVAFVLSAHYNLAEAFRRLTGPYERLQLDELPVVLLVVALGLVAFAWRRYRDARRELRQRQRAEAHLATTLEENRRLARRFIDVQEAERRALARELHDELGQYLNAIKLDAVAVAGHAREVPLRSRAQSIVHSVDHVHGVVQTLIRRFRPVALDELGLQAALEHNIDHWRRRLPQATLTLSAPDGFDDLGEPTNLAIYRIVQEGLTNVSRHARATRVTVRLERGPSVHHEREEIHLVIEDNGIGVDLRVRGLGLGLVGMRERAEALGGAFRMSSEPGCGFLLDAVLPVQPVVGPA